MPTPDKIVLEHTGALGDFLLAWPAFLALSRHFAGLAVYQAVTPAHAPWLAPLAAPCPPVLRRALDARYASDTWPAELDGVLVVRPGLDKAPFADREGFWFLRGVEADCADSPRELYLTSLLRRGIKPAGDFQATFRELFGGYRPRERTALLFPGAGHTDKTWPMSSFDCLASQLRNHDIEPVFVLGPAEIERDVRAPGNRTVLTPKDLAGLSAALCAASFVVGPDSGTLHLAAMHGVPGVVLFGPTSPRQWGPLGLAVVTANLDCAPCTVLTVGDFAPGCPKPLPCLAGIAVEAVLERLASQKLIPGGL